MHNRYIGDSLDAAKCVVLTLLADAGINARVVPLPSHVGFDYDSFGRCVTPQNGDIIFRSEIPYAGHHKQQYMANVSAWLDPNADTIDCIIFDPDTGIRPDRDTNKFLGLWRVRQFIDRFPSMAVGVYQHRGTGQLSYPQSLELLPSHDCCGYDFGSAALLFWATVKGASKVRQIKAVFEGRLHARRVVTAKLACRS